MEKNSGICSGKSMGGNSQAQGLPDGRGQETSRMNRRFGVCVCVGGGSGTGGRVPMEEVQWGAESGPEYVRET